MWAARAYCTHFRNAQAKAEAAEAGLRQLVGELREQELEASRVRMAGENERATMVRFSKCSVARFREWCGALR